MDYILLAICGLYFLKGYFKGFVAMFFSLVGTFGILILSFQLSNTLLPQLETLFGKNLSEALTNLFDKTIVGEFSSIDELANQITKSNILNFFLAKFLQDISFDGKLTAGQILAPSVSVIVLRVCAFVVLFVFMYIILKILRHFISKIIKKCGLSFQNRIIGGAVGLFKGLVVFGVVFFVLSTFSNVLLNESFSNFVNGGAVSNLIYNNLIAKILAFFY